MLWNSRDISSHAFAVEYENFIQKHAVDYDKVNHRFSSSLEAISDFLGGPCRQHEFSNSQSLDFEGLLGRLASSSYMPNENHERYDEMHNELKILFKKHCINKKVKIIYSLILYWGYFS